MSVAHAIHPRPTLSLDILPLVMLPVVDGLTGVAGARDRGHYRPCERREARRGGRGFCEDFLGPIAAAAAAVTVASAAVAAAATAAAALQKHQQPHEERARNRSRDKRILACV